MNDQSLGQHYFDQLYESEADPWNFQTSGYEREKYAATLAALPCERYKSAVEIGCSIGVLTKALAPRCEQVLGLDIAQAAIAAARIRCADLPQVRFEVAQFPHIDLQRTFDLILLSEVLYYFAISDIAAVARKVRKIATTGSNIVCVHWLGPTPDYPMNGDQAVDAFEHALADGEPIFRDRQPEYRIDIYRLPPTG